MELQLGGRGRSKPMRRSGPGDPPKLLTQPARELAANKSITHVAAVHCETTTGILNPIHEIGKVVQKHNRTYVLDAMSSFGAIPIDFAAGGIDYLISSANKCLEGVPGFSLVIARRSALLACEGYARSLSLDLLDQLKGFEKNGQFRYTPPTHAILAFQQALNEFDQEGGVSGRAARYHRNHAILAEGMKQMGFRPYLPPDLQSYIITAFHYPHDPRFSFHDFYHRLSDRGFIIYPGKLSHFFNIIIEIGLFTWGICILYLSINIFLSSFLKGTTTVSSVFACLTYNISFRTSSGLMFV